MLTRQWFVEPPWILGTWWLETHLSSTWHGNIQVCIWSSTPHWCTGFLFDGQSTNTSVLFQVWVRSGWGFFKYRISQDFISRGGHLRSEWWDRVKGSSCCYARRDCIVTVKTRCLVSMACQLLAVQGGNKRPRWLTLWKQGFSLLPPKYLVPVWETD